MSGKWSEQPLAHHAYGTVIYWLSYFSTFLCAIGTFIAVAIPCKNCLDPHFLFFTIWQGSKPNSVWSSNGASYAGPYFFIKNIAQGDSLTQCGLTIGCVSAGIAFVAAAIGYMNKKNREPGWAAICIFSAAIILMAALGIVQVAE